MKMYAEMHMSRYGSVDAGMRACRDQGRKVCVEVEVESCVHACARGRKRVCVWAEEETVNMCVEVHV